MPPDDVMLAFNFIRAIQAGDVDAAEDFAAGDYPSMAALLVDVAERIVTPVTALPDQVAGEPCADTFALEALGHVFIRTLRTWEQSCPSTATGTAEAIIGFTKEILTEDHEDVAEVLEQLQWPPFTCRMLTESIAHRDQSSSPRTPSSSRMTRCSLDHTRSRLHWAKRW